MTNLLLIIIAVLLLARIVLQVRQGKRAFEKGYCAPSEVENVRVEVTLYEIDEKIKYYGILGYEFVQIIEIRNGPTNPPYHLFFTRKKIKNYWEK